VLVALSLFGARLVGFLDWRAGVRLAGDTQGDQLLLGKNTKSSTALKHVYDSERPVFTITRTCERDKLTQTVKLDAGTLTLTVDKSGKTSKVTQTEAQIELLVAGSGAGTSIKQTGDDVTIKCTNFKVDASQVDVNGQTSASLKAASVKVTGQSDIALVADGTATLKGALTNVQGNLVNLG
jgi:hypothetical protein